MSAPRHALGLVAAALPALLAAPACVTEGPPPRAEPAPIPRQPAGLVPTRLALFVGNQAADSDGNGYPDTFEVAAYLFADNYVYTIAVPGRLSFTLSDREGRALARWTFDDAQTAAIARQLPPGPGYPLRLSLREVGGDKYPPQSAELSAEFVPQNGAALRSRSGAVRIGGSG